MLKPPVYYVYIVRCANGSYYTGQTKNIDRRIKQHNGLIKTGGARYTRNHRPVTLVHLETYKTRSFAMQREIELKKLNHKQKYDLVNCL